LSEYNMKPVIPEDYVWQLQVRSATHLEDWIQDYFDGLKITYQKDGSCILSGQLPDMPAVYGFILHLRDTGISLLSLQVNRVAN